MKKSILFMYLLLFSASVGAQVNPYFQGSFEQAKAEAGKSERQLIVFYYSDG